MILQNILVIFHDGVTCSSKFIRILTWLEKTLVKIWLLKGPLISLYLEVHIIVFLKYCCWGYSIFPLSSIYLWIYMLRKYLALSGSQAEVYYGNLVQSPEKKAANWAIFPSWLCPYVDNKLSIIDTGQGSYFLLSHWRVVSRVLLPQKVIGFF